MEGQERAWGEKGATELLLISCSKFTMKNMQASHAQVSAVITFDANLGRDPSVCGVVHALPAVILAELFKPRHWKLQVVPKCARVYVSVIQTN
jgi:hypothetical protein